MASTFVPAPLADVWAWWTDFGDAGQVAHIAHGLGWSRRRVIESGPRRIVFDEEVPWLPQRTRVVRRTAEIDAGNRVLLESGRGWLWFDARWAFREEHGGTRVVRSVEVRHSKWRLVPAWIAKQIVRVDLEHHGRECAADLARASAVAASTAAAPSDEGPAA